MLTNIFNQGIFGQKITFLDQISIGGFALHTHAHTQTNVAMSLGQTNNNNNNNNKSFI